MPEDRRAPYRIGISLGEAIADGGTIYGVKAELRRVAVRDKDAPRRALGPALDRVLAEPAKGHFRRCGYERRDQSTVCARARKGSASLATADAPLEQFAERSISSSASLTKRTMRASGLSVPGPSSSLPRSARARTRPGTSEATLGLMARCRVEGERHPGAPRGRPRALSRPGPAAAPPRRGGGARSRRALARHEGSRGGPAAGRRAISVSSSRSPAASTATASRSPT